MMSMVRSPCFKNAHDEPDRGLCIYRPHTS